MPPRKWRKLVTSVSSAAWTGATQKVATASPRTAPRAGTARIRSIEESLLFEPCRRRVATVACANFPLFDGNLRVASSAGERERAEGLRTALLDRRGGTDLSCDARVTEGRPRGRGHPGGLDT